jgi:hypothetical protein
MSKLKLIFFVTLIAGLLGLSLYFNRDWFASDTIRVSHRLSPWMQKKRPGVSINPNDLNPPVTFALNGIYQLKSVRVVEVSRFETNKYTVPAWRIISDSNSALISTFNYGSDIQGMRLEAKGVPPEPLQSGIKYRLFLVTDKGIKAQHDFMLPTRQ